jgi:hypothetical protein
MPRAVPDEAKKENMFIKRQHRTGRGRDKYKNSLRMLGAVPELSKKR